MMCGHTVYVVDAWSVHRTGWLLRTSGTSTQDQRVKKECLSSRLYPLLKRATEGLAARYSYRGADRCLLVPHVLGSPPHNVLVRYRQVRLAAQERVPDQLHDMAVQPVGLSESTMNHTWV